MPNLINLRKIRKACGLTQKELAEKVDVSESFISQCESGNKSPSLEVALKIAEVLNVETADLVTERTGLLDAIVNKKEQKKEPILITKDGHEIDEVEFNALVYAITHELSPELYPKFKQFVELAADNPDSAERFLSFAVQELESSKQSH